MTNPFLNKMMNGVRYTLYWTLLIIIHTFVLIGHYKMAIFPAIMDALVFNILFSVMAPSLWFVIQFSRKDFLSLSTTLVATCLFTISSWLWLSNRIMRSVFEESSTYLRFLEESMLARGIEGIFIFALCILVFYVLYYIEMYKEKIEQEGKVQHLLKEAELERLKAQINPHFIFNSLNSINVLTMTNPDQAQEMVILLSDFLRHSLGQNIQEETTLETEIDNISRYLAIEKVRFGELLVFDTIIEEELKSCRLPNMLLQPLAENAIKYGVYESTQPVSIRIEAQREDDYLQLKMQNTFDPEAKPKKGKGIGIKNLSDRLYLIYGRDDLIQIQREEDQFTVSLRIPQVNQPMYEAH